MGVLSVPLLFAGALCAAAAAPQQPNIILMITDDQDVEMGSLTYMPKLQHHLAAGGATFNNMYAAVPVCCPSRSALYSGRFQHNNHVLGNGVDTNCSSLAWQQTMEPLSFAVHLQAAGWATSFAGKYLNCYGGPAVGGTAHIPQGWKNWQGLVGNSAYYGYKLSNNGVTEPHGTDYAADYLPNLILNRTLDFIRAEHAADPTKPFFAAMSLPSCHGPQDAAPQYASLHPELKAPRTPAYNATVTDSHWLQSVQAVYGLDDNSAAFADLVFRRRILTLLTVDDIIESVVGTLGGLGVLDNTYILYTSDNGYHTGHYGFIYDKRQPWETDTHLPLFLRGPGITGGATSDAVVTMPDLSATVLDMAGVPLPDGYDGTSILGYVSSSSSSPPPTPRLMTLVEYHGESDGGGGTPECARTDGSSMYCNPDGVYQFPPYFNGTNVCVCQDAVNNTYSCLRVKNTTVDFRYCEFTDAVSTVELFDYRTDPYELTNLAGGADPALHTELSGRLALATSCVGAAACNVVFTAPLQRLPPALLHEPRETPSVLQLGG